MLYQTYRQLWLTLMLKNEKYKRQDRLKAKQNKTILVISIATLPTVLVFSGAVNKKTEKNRLFIPA